MVQSGPYSRLPARRSRGARVTDRVHPAQTAIDDLAADAGYALVDALVGLLIIALGLVFALQAGHQARLAADQAAEVRQAQALLGQLLETGPRSFEDAAGATDTFSWTLETRITGGERPIEVCHRQATLKNLRSRRSYRAATLETCPAEAAG